MDDIASHGNSLETGVISSKGNCFGRAIPQGQFSNTSPEAAVNHPAQTSSQIVDLRSQIIDELSLLGVFELSCRRLFLRDVADSSVLRPAGG